MYSSENGSNNDDSSSKVIPIFSRQSSIEDTRSSHHFVAILIWESESLVGLIFVRIRAKRVE